MVQVKQNAAKDKKSEQKEISKKETVGKKAEKPKKVTQVKREDAVQKSVNSRVKYFRSLK